MSDARPISLPVVVNADGTDGPPPAVPPRVRSFTYFALLGLSATASLVTGLAAVWTPGIAADVAATSGAVLAAAGMIGGGLGVAYRPTVR